MLDKSAVKELLKFTAIAAAADAVAGTTSNMPLALPDDFKLHDIEPYLPMRRRARGAMVTTLLPDFAAYVGTFKEEGASCFVQEQHMRAVAVLNLGTPVEPGHADNVARFEPPKTAAYKALLEVAHGNGLTQKKVAEFIEDWKSQLACFRGIDGDEAVGTLAGIAAVRDITIESLNKSGNKEGQLSAERSTFEKVAVADNDKPVPTLIQFKCVPYVGLQERTFALRLGILTGERAPSITLRIVKKEEHDEQMATELAGLVRQALQGIAPVVIGTYAASS